VRHINVQQGITVKAVSPDEATVSQLAQVGARTSRR
jgi:hypothetical protein